MRLPQVSDRIKEAPAQALRGVFAGIGQLLLITDRVRNKTPASQQVPQARTPKQPETRADPAPAARPTQSAPLAPSAQRVTEVRDFDKTGNVRLITSEEAGADRRAPAADAAAPVSAVTAEAAATAQAEPGPPLPNYGELSIASLRARLRNLDLTQLRQLAGYEKAHAARAEVMTMFERRIAKLEAEADADRHGEAEADANRRAGADAEAAAEAREEVAAEVPAEVAAEAENEA